MASPTFIDRLEVLPPVSLEALDAHAPLLTRRDRKYLVPIAVAERMLAELTPELRVLTIDGRRRFRYESIYFDTPGHDSYLTAARRRPQRFKVRTRAYLDTGRCVLEVKTRDGRGRTVKTQHAKELAGRHRLDPWDRAIVVGYPQIGAAARALEPAVMTRYTRATLIIDSVHARATIDTDLTVVAPDGATASLAEMAIVECKSAGPPSRFDRLLWSLGHRPISLSKFGTGLAALFPELPSNRWHRALGASWQVRRPAALTRPPRRRPRATR